MQCSVAPLNSVLQNSMRANVLVRGSVHFIVVCSFFSWRAPRATKACARKSEVQHVVLFYFWNQTVMSCFSIPGPVSTFCFFLLPLARGASQRKQIAVVAEMWLR